MRRIVTGLGALVVVAAATAAAAQTDAWKEYVYPDDGFAISAPSEPEVTSQPIYVAGAPPTRMSIRSRRGRTQH